MARAGAHVIAPESHSHAMHLEADAVIPFDRDLVFRTYRDELTTLVEFLPGVRRIELIDRSGDDHETLCEHRFHGGAEIPIAVQKVLGDTVFRWDERARWDGEGYTRSWQIETGAFPEAVRCAGTHAFVEIGGRTRVEISGRMHIDLRSLKGVPSFLAGSLGRTVEQFVARQITATLLSVSDGITRYLEAQTIA